MFNKKWRNWTKPKNFTIYLCICFYRYYQYLIITERTGKYPFSAPNFNISLSFSNFLNPKSQIVWNLLRQFAYNVLYPKYYDQDCLKKFRLLMRSLIKIQIPEYNHTQFIKEVISNFSWKVFGCNSWLKLNMVNRASRKLFKMKLCRNLFCLYFC